MKSLAKQYYEISPSTNAFKALCDEKCEVSYESGLFNHWLLADDSSVRISKDNKTVWVDGRIV